MLFRSLSSDSVVEELLICAQGAANGVLLKKLLRCHSFEETGRCRYARMVSRGLLWCCRRFLCLARQCTREGI